MDAICMCAFCGEEVVQNAIECTVCGDCYHPKCLTKRQMARFKGRRWQCDACVRRGQQDCVAKTHGLVDEGDGQEDEVEISSRADSMRI